MTRWDDLKNSAFMDRLRSLFVPPEDQDEEEHTAAFSQEDNAYDILDLQLNGNDSEELIEPDTTQDLILRDNPINEELTKVESKMPPFLSEKTEPLNSYQNIDSALSNDYNSAKTNELNRLPENWPGRYLKDLLVESDYKEETECDLCKIEAKKLEGILLSSEIPAEVFNCELGPSLIRFDVALASGIHVKRVIELHDEIKFAMSAKSVRIIAPHPGKSHVTIEVSRAEFRDVRLRSIIEDPSYDKTPILTVPFGLESASGSRPYFCNIKSESIILISGSNGSGKTNFINCIICSAIYKYTPEEVQFLMIDSNEFGMKAYNDIPHLILPVATDYSSGVDVISFLEKETERRLNELLKYEAKNIDAYNMNQNKVGGKTLPHIILIIENYYSLFKYNKEISSQLSYIGLKCKNAGIHIIFTTAETSERVIPRLLMQSASFKGSFVQADKKESVNAIGESGAEDLLRFGDMLVMTSDQRLIRVQTPLIEYSEVLAIAKYFREKVDRKPCPPVDSYIEMKLMQDKSVELFVKAVEAVIENESASVSLLQRRLGIGYPSAARMIDELEQHKIIGPFEGSKPRRILVTRDEWEKNKMLIVAKLYSMNRYNKADIT